MELLSRDALKLYIEKIQQQKLNFDIKVLKSISSLEDSDVLFLLYNNMLVMDKFKNGLLTNDLVANTVKIAAESSSEGKVLKSQYEYLIEQIKKHEGFDKIQYLDSMKTFIAWISDEVNFTTK